MMNTLLKLAGVVLGSYLLMAGSVQATEAPVNVCVSSSGRLVYVQDEGVECGRGYDTVTLAVEGPQGAIGPQGPTGNNGAQGTQGIEGPQGPIGLSGASGQNGTNGADGTQGPIGLTGPTGDPGTDTLGAMVCLDGESAVADGSGGWSCGSPEVSPVDPVISDQLARLAALEAIAGGGSSTFFLEFTSFSNSSCCNNLTWDSVGDVGIGASIFENSTQPKPAYGNPLPFDVEVVSVQFMHSYVGDGEFTLGTGVTFNVQPFIVSLDGTVDRALTAPLNLATAVQNDWITLPLTSATAADNLVDADLASPQYVGWLLNSVMAGGKIEGNGVLRVEVKKVP